MSARFARVAQTGHKTFATSRPDAPFGGYKRSGSGRQHGIKGIDGYPESSAIPGFQVPRPSASRTAFQLFNEIIAQPAGAKK
ncbi:hypothetical protein HDG37_006238 [Paraburkholderia sp. MM5384-R2]|nr:hypothetical protein [Paraburkholderia sp. MM5384-R2]